MCARILSKQPTLGRFYVDTELIQWLRLKVLLLTSIGMKNLSCNLIPSSYGIQVTLK